MKEACQLQGIHQLLFLEIAVYLVVSWVGPERGLFPVSVLGLKPQFSSELREEAWRPVVRNEAQ